MVVDDDFNTCDSVTKMLVKVGMRSEWTLSGKEAVPVSYTHLMQRQMTPSMQIFQI